MSQSSTPHSTTHFFQEKQIFSIAMLRLLGYSLLAMAAIDYVSLMIPPQFMNPTWEFQTVGAVVERIPLVLLGMVLIFYGERDARKAIEHKLLKWFSWLALVFAIFLFICFPLTIINGFRIYYSGNANLNAQTAPRIDALTKFQGDLEEATSLPEISAIMQQQSNRRINIPDSIDKDKLKNKLLENINKNQQQIKSQIKSSKKTRKISLFKDSIKWNLGALISGCLFLFIWKQSIWARIPYEIEDY